MNDTSSLLPFKKISPKLIVLGIIIVLLATGLIYLFIVRPSDEDYQKALDQLSSMQKNVADMNQAYDALQYPGYIRSAAVAFLNSTATSYSQANDKLAKSGAVSRGFAGPIAYSQYKAALSQYGASLNNLAASVAAYAKAHDVCVAFLSDLSGATSTSTFDTEATDCHAAINAGRSAPYKKFTDQFLTKYLDNLQALVAANRAAVEKPGDGTVLENLYHAKLAIYNMGQLKLSLTIEAEPSMNLKKLLDALTAQKSSFWR